MKNLFVGNMSFQTTESDLTSPFKGFGQVTRVHVAMDRETGRARSFAFVEMPNGEEAAKAIAGLDGKELGGRTLKVNEARPKTERTAPHRVAVGVEGEDRADSQMKITAKPRVSRVNLAGSPKRSGWGIPNLHSDSKETRWPLRS
jgi:RNA recognition motif-containing protein